MFLLQAVHQLKPAIEELSSSSNNIYNYVHGMSDSLRERQRVFTGGTNRITFKLQYENFS